MFQGIGEGENYSHLRVSTIRLGTDSDRWQYPERRLGVLLFVACLISWSGCLFNVEPVATMVFVGTFKPDISFRSSRLSTTGRRSVVYGQADIDLIIRPLGGRTGAVLLFSNGHQPQNWQ